MKKSIEDHKAFVRELEFVVRLYGEDHVHADQCEYFKDDGAPLCLIGQVLARLGYDAKFIDEFFFGLERINTKEAPYILRPLGYSEDLVGAAWAAQRAQDSQEDWGIALDEFHDHLKAKGKLEEYGVTPRTI